jgi:hypothetical protein
MAGMIPYVVRRGDYLLKIALRMGFDADTVWNDPKNADLRAARPNNRLLCVGDVLYVPEKPPRAWQSLSVGSSNKFKATVPAVHVALKFVFEGKPLASKKCTIRELPALGELTTKSDGALEFDVPMAMDLVTVLFADMGLIQPLRIGHLDPVTEPSGVYQRLNNLGCVLDEPDDSGAPSAQDLKEPLADFLRAEGMSDASGDLDDAARAKLKSVYGC